MGKVSFLRWSRKASRRRHPLSRGLKKEEELRVTRRICSLMKSVAHPCPLVTYHLPCKLMVSPVGASQNLLPDKPTLCVVIIAGSAADLSQTKTLRGHGVADCSGTATWSTSRILPRRPLPPVVSSHPPLHTISPSAQPRPQGLGGSLELPVRSLPRHCFQKGLNKYVQQEGEPGFHCPLAGN